MMKKSLYYWDFVLPAVVVLLSIIAAVLSLPYHIDSLCDEGFLWLWVQNAQNGKVGDGSLWANMLASVLGEKICSSIFSLRVVNGVLSFLTVLVFWLITKNNVAKGTASKVLFLVMLFFVLNPIAGIVVCYNGISRFFLVLACAAMFRLFFDDKLGGLWALLLGFAITISFFSILPSAVLIGGCAVVLLVVRFWGKWRDMGIYVVMMFLGCVLALLFVHFVVADLRDVYSGMVNTAKTITTVNRGYDPLSMIIKVLLFFRDYFLFLMASFGIICTSYLLKKNLPRLMWLGSVFYVLSFLVYWYYQKEPGWSISMFLSLLWIQQLIGRWEDGIPKIKSLFGFDSLFNCFLCFFPLLATIGTNVPIGSKMMWFVLPWGLLLWRLGFDGKNAFFRGELLLVLSLLLSIGCYRQFKSIDISLTKVANGPLAGMRLEPSQESHFEEVGEILQAYHYQRGKSVVFSTQLSMMTICYYEAVPCGLFFQPMDFVAHSSDDLQVPDFLFLCRFDETVAGEKLKDMPWGWPEQFDRYFVGTPEDVQVGYPTDRWLYCRKNLKE